MHDVRASKPIPRHEVAAEEGACPPLPFTQIAFAGHNRPADLGDRRPLARDLVTAFEMLKQAGVGNARLLTGLASGADELALAAWNQVGLGPVHAVFPFLDDAAGEGVGAPESATWLDGAAAEASGRHPHLQQTRWLLGVADLLVVVWTGAHARGAGGTADAVRLALDRGLSVLWVKPAEPGRLRLIRPARPPQDLDFSELQEILEAGDTPHVEVATPKRLHDLLRLEVGELHGDPAAADDTKVESGFDAWLHGWLWKSYAAFRRWVGGRVARGPGPGPPPADLAAQHGFQVMTEGYIQADHRANRLAAVHRSEQILLLFAMVTAATVGSSPALWPGLKLAAVYVELLLGLAAALVWLSAARARRHEQWSEARRLAEQLRLERAGWAIGASLPAAEHGSAHDHGGLGREVLRNAGLPHGRFDADRVQSWGGWAMSELVGGQAAYHRVLSTRDGRIAHRIHVGENFSFVVLLVLLAGYILGYEITHAMHTELPHWLSGVVVMAGTIVPAIGAAAMALEAKLEFTEQSSRSRVIAERLETLAAQLGREPRLHMLQGAARTAMGWLVSEANQWREGANRRRLFRP